MMVSGVDPLARDRFNQQLCYNEIEEDHFYSAPKPEVLKEMPSEKKTGFLGGLLRRSSESFERKEEKQELRRSSGLLSIFGRRASTSEELRRSQGSQIESSEALRRSQEELDADAYLARLRDMDGRTDEEIAALTSPVASDNKEAMTSPKKSSGLSQWFSSMHQALKEEFSMRREEYVLEYPPPPFVEDPQHLTVSISAAPFFAAPPPETDMSLEELATFEPVYQPGVNLCVNNLPVKKYDGTPLPGEQKCCAICTAEFEQKEELKALPCVHFFHRECIDRWLMVGHNCPVCKALVL